MKTKILTSIMLFSLLTPLASCNTNEKVTTSSGLMTTDSYFSDDNFNPTLRFSVCSDVHFGNNRTALSGIITKMCNFNYDFASNSSYKNVDAVLVAGDIADTGDPFVWSLFKSELESALKEETKSIIIMGNHDFRTNGNKSEEEFLKVFGVPTDNHEIINGFHFISLSPTNEAGFSNEKVKWLDKQLEKASKDDPSKPIFVMQHMNVSNTVVGSDNWGVPELTSTLEKYPQVIDFSGHSHFPIKDPRSIYQGSFTALGTGTMFYYELGLNGFAADGLFPIDQFGSFAPSAAKTLSAAEYYIVEVDKNNSVRITGIDLLTKTVICQYGIKQPSNKDSFIYTSANKNNNAVEPFFDKKHQVSASVGSTSIELHIKQAYCKDLIESYRVDVYKENKKVNSFYALSGYYLNPMPEEIYVTLSGLESKIKYRIDIYAITCLGKSNKKPLSYEITTS